MQIFAQSPAPQILQIHRDFLGPGNHATYRRIEQDIARVCVELGFPHAYLAIEPLTGPEEVWFLNGWESEAEQKEIADAYAKNAPLVAALEMNGKRKAGLISKAVEVFANYRQDLSRGEPWSMGLGRFLVITVTQDDRRFDGTVFQTLEGTKFVLLPAKTREEADAKAVKLGVEARVFAVRPYWSSPAEEWISADPVFWKSSPARKPKANPR
jgi:hypothetical protein